MSPLEEYQIKLEIEQIIDRSRHQEEMLLIDSKAAASNILLYLKQENLISTAGLEGGR
jgi:hypothetical protein